jgi:hypothetical protein
MRDASYELTLFLARRHMASLLSFSFPSLSVRFFYCCSRMSHTSSQIDECDMQGRTFVDLGSGVGQVSLNFRIMLSQPARVWQHRLTSARLRFA